MKKTKTQLAKSKALAQFSVYIRTRDCLRFTGNPSEGLCVTCKRHYPFKQLQAGHFIQGRGNSILFDERLVYSQCVGCNLNPPYGKGGNYVEYFVFMEQEWGRDKVDEFRVLKHDTVKYKETDYKQIEQNFRQKTLDLLKIL